MTALVEELSQVAYPVNEPRFTLGYLNKERDIRRIAGEMRITVEMRKRMAAKKAITPEQLAALEKLLVLFHPSSPII